ncbi:hypothetical protein LIER_18100 [Lithospermum erythrorhizon]|uniref:Uncharacterized protein n=1 Tax=Lithospermum erythrorhizon TaxID=34254 RepID=A0AAV3QCQ8_LITER
MFGGGGVCCVQFIAPFGPLALTGNESTGSCNWIGLAPIWVSRVEIVLRGMPVKLVLVVIVYTSYFPEPFVVVFPIVRMVEQCLGLPISDLREGYQTDAVVDDLYRAIHGDPAVESDQSAPGSDIPVATSSTVNPPMARTDGTSPRPAETASDDILRAAKECVEPQDVPFSTMAGERWPLFRKVKVRKVSVSSETGSMAVPVATPTPATTSASQSRKRSSPDSERPMAFGTRKKHAARRPKRIETIIIAEDPPSRSPPTHAAPTQEPSPPPAPSPRASLKSPASRKRADEALQKLKEVEESVPLKVEEACRLREKELIQQYHFSEDFRNEADWFASCDLEAPLTPKEEDDEEAAPPGDESAV